MSQDNCETVKVVHAEGYMVINKSDLTKDHKIYKEKSEPKATEKPKSGKKAK